ncbi:uncharacterized protein Tie isoform X2 [Eurosta solidaginis]|uniref:uncharacterized protein Tie isoform X2 n=1 Tax=Eurosta solidaginis TaxID=178769 RepID=UPI0035317C76
MLLKYLVIMNVYLRKHAVVLTVLVLYIIILKGSNGKNLAILQSDKGSRDDSDNVAQSKSRMKDIVVEADSEIFINSQQTRHQRYPQENQGDTPLLPSSSTLKTPSVSILTEKDDLKTTETTDTLHSGEVRIKLNASKEIMNKNKGTSEDSSISTSTRPNRPAVTPTNVAQERERKLMNVLAARRNALHNDRFRTRIVTTGRTVTMTSMENPSRAPTDPRSICIRNCTKNFTRRTTASCMRECSNFSRTFLAASKDTYSPISNVEIVRPSSPIITQTTERDNNEILFTDESSHGLFVVAKEQNGTLNHIPDVIKNEKYRTRNKLLSTATTQSTSIEDEDIQPYLYFGQKLPPIKPATLTITSVSEEHPKLLEVSVSKVSSSTPRTLVSPPTLSAVERSRSRYKYRDRGYVSAGRSPFRASALTSINSSEAKSGLLSNKNGNTSLASNVTTLKKDIRGEENVMDGSVDRSDQRCSTLSPLIQSVDAPTPLIIKVYADEDESEQIPQFKNASIKEGANYPESDLIANKTNIQKNGPGQSSTSSSFLEERMVSQMTTLNTNIQRNNITSLRPFTSTTLATILKTKRVNPTTKILNISTSDSTTLPTSTQRANIIVHEDIEELGGLGPHLTREIINDENSIRSKTDTTTSKIPLFDIVTTIQDVKDAPTFILHTTIVTSVRSTVNSHTENPFLQTETTSPQWHKKSGLSYVGIIETTPFEKLVRSHPPLMVRERDVSQEMRRVNIATMVLAAIGIIPLCALVLYLVRSYLLRRKGKSEEDFDVCITDQQPISPVKKLDSKYRIKKEDEQDDTDHHTVYTSQHSQITTRETNYNDRYDERCSVTSDQEFDRNNIRLKSLLGEGNFGQVWKAEADDLSGHFGATRIVAVKTIRKCSAQSGLKEEADIMRKLGSHQNVVTLLGACVESEPHMLIMEYAMRGRLLSLLRAARSATNILPASVPGGRSLTPLSPRTLGGFALDIACGMEYIAEKRIVHRDLAARNVLLDHNGVCKICDFGMSIDLDAARKRKEIENSHTNEIIQNNSKKNKFDFGSRFIINQWNSNFKGSNCSQNLGKYIGEHNSNIHGHVHSHDTISRRPALPIRWMAPEALQYHTFTSDTDVWAFGIVLWEIATLGAIPYANLSGREIIRRVPNGLRPELPKEGRHEFYNLMTRCWNKDPNLRPSFTYARQEISRTMHKLVEDDSASSDYMDVSGFSEDLEHGIVYFNHRISEFECEI